MRRVLLGLAVALAIGACSRSAAPTSPRAYLVDLERSIRAEIDEPVREEVLLGRVEELGVALEAFEDSLASAQEQMARIGVRQEATLDELRPPLEAMGGAREDFVREVVRIRLAMREDMSRREWDAVEGKGLLERLLGSVRG